MQRRKRNTLIMFTLVMIAVAAVTASLFLTTRSLTHSTDPGPSQAVADIINQTRPDFSLPDLAGNSRDISEWDGKLLVINFWASWCLPCLREIPDFIRLQHQYGRDGLQFIGIAIDELESVRRFLAQLEQPVNYPILIAGNEAITVAKRYGNASGVLPYTVIIDRHKMTVFTQYGAFEPPSAERQIQKFIHLAD